MILVSTKSSQMLKYRLTLGLATMEDRGFYYPSDTAIGNDGKLYTVSRSFYGSERSVRVTILNDQSEYFGTFASFGYEDGQLIWPTSIAIDNNGYCYVADEYHHRITIYDDSGSYVKHWGSYGLGGGHLNGPSGLVFDHEYNLYVVDHYNNRVVKFTKDGKLLNSFGIQGTDNGQFNFPWGITLDSEGNIYVADWRNDRIQKFTAEGVFQMSLGSSGRGESHFSRPSSVAVDSNGNIYVADWGNERLQVFDACGRFITLSRGEATNSKWAEDFFNINLEEAEARSKSDLEPDLDQWKDDPYEQSSHVEKYFWSPVSVKLSEEGTLYVTESNRHRIQVFNSLEHN